MRFAVLRSTTQAPKRFRWNETKRCYWCGRSTTYNGTYHQKPARATREHIVPKSHGGGDGGNRVVACLRCNTTRNRDMTWVPFHKLPSGLRKKAPMRLIGDDYEEVFA